MGINKTKETQHCGTKPKKIAFGIAPVGIVSIGIVPMGVISIGVVPMGVFSFGAVAMGIVNLSVVGMGIISAGVTTMGIWKYSPNSHNNQHNHSKQISNSNKENLMSDLFNTNQEAASKYKCIEAHKMGNEWMPCKIH